MAMPEINILFKTLAKTASIRSARGVACIILKDSTVDGKYIYTREKQIAQSFEENNLSLIKEAFNKYGVTKLVVYAINKTGGTLEDALDNLKKVEINYLACNFALEENDITLLKQFKGTRVNNNMDLQIIANTTADDEYFINFASTGIKVNNVAIEPYTFMCKLAFILASIPQTESATYYVLDDVTGVDEIENEDEAVEAGKLFITFDGEKYKLSRAVNSKTTLGANEKKDLKKIKITAGKIIVKGDIYKVFRDKYVGKCNNDYNDRLSFVSEINRYLTNLAYEGILNIDYDNHVELDVQAMRDYIETEVSIDTSDMKDIDVLKDAEGLCGSKVFIKGQVRFVDAMEDMDLVLYM